MPAVRDKILSADAVEAATAQLRQAGRRIVHAHGCFDVVHPGHLRYLEFARDQGDVLVVSITSDDAIEKNDGTRPHVPQELRAETLAALELVDLVVTSPDPTAEGLIARIKPDVYVKGKDYEGSDHPGFLREQALVESFGGRVVFSSGEVVFSSTTLLSMVTDRLESDGLSQAVRLRSSCQRWGLDVPGLTEMVGHDFAGKRVLVLGDAIQDDYVFCHTRDVASEAPILSVSPLEKRTYVGGAAVIAAHLRGLGARPHLVTTVGQDGATAELVARMQELDVEMTTLVTRRMLPRKLRYLVGEQKLLKVDEGERRPLDSAQQREVMASLGSLAEDADALIVADFGYGTVTADLVRRIGADLRHRIGVLAGDVSGHRDTLSAFRGYDLLAPTERELRSIRGDFASSLPGVAQQHMAHLGLGNMMVTMGSRGALLFRPREERREDWFHGRLRSDYLPALGNRVVDPVGAGDAMLATAVLTMAAGGDLTAAGYMGSAAAAVEIAQLGNRPLDRPALLGFLSSRPELQTGLKLLNPERHDHRRQTG